MGEILQLFSTKYYTVECVEGEVRIYNGTSTEALVGRVDVCLGGAWGGACGTGWDNREAAVVCRHVGGQLGVSILGE